MDLRVNYLGLRDYEPQWRDMQAFTDLRDAHTPDEFRVVEHPPVFTLGLNGREEHILDPGVIPVVRVDRGGQVTYHGPGQIVVYLLVDLRRKGLGVRALVSAMELAIIRFLAGNGIDASAMREAPGVYVQGRKIASLGLRVRRGCSYHGLAFNLDMDLGPFGRIDPCGMRGLRVTQFSDLAVSPAFGSAARGLVDCLVAELGYEAPCFDWSGR